MNKSASGAKKYYSESYYNEGKNFNLNYYSEKDQVIGIWGGKGAEKLSLKGGISKEDFADLCDNKIPGSDKKLTGRNETERRVGYDFTFNASKSVSLAYTFSNDQDKQELLKAFRESVADTMKEIETGMQARVRDKGKNENRETGNIAYGEFIHFTTRPIDGIPDPHLHAHCFVFNATYDETDKKWKAGQFGQIKQDAPYYEAYFHSKLAANLKELGYQMECTENGLELKGVAKETIDKFSRRTKEIEDYAKEYGITDEKKKAEIGSKTRESKRFSKNAAKEFTEWKCRLTEEQYLNIKNLKNHSDNSANDNARITAKEAINYSLNLHLERKSVASDKEILSTAIKNSIGDTTPEEINKEFSNTKGLLSVKEGLRTFITTRTALEEERQLIMNANSFKGKYKPINSDYKLQSDILNDQQRLAVNHALTTSDGLTIIVGKAGTGKTTLMLEVQRGIKASGKQIFAFAPSSEASRVVQRNEGFENADTVASMFQKESTHPQLRNQVIWVDEAGQLSNKDLNKLFEIAKAQNARIILSGDTKQHSSVERGDALRIVQKYAKIDSITVSKIQRQKNTEYRQAVKYLSESKIEKGFSKLENIGAIKEIEDKNERIKAVAEDYCKSAFQGKKLKDVLVISPTHAEGDLVTNEIRNRLKEENLIKGVDREFTVYKNLQWTEAEKQSARKYKQGQIIKFHQNVKGIMAGSKLKVISSDEKQVKATDIKGKEYILPLKESNRFNVFEEKKINVTTGDKIRITENSKGIDGKHLFNGTSFKITGFDKQGNIKLSNGSMLSQTQGNFTLGYVMTSHSSQGKTTDKIIILQSSLSFRASSKQQFYVSVSRGREAVSIYTDDKKELLHAVSQTSERKSASELMGNMIKRNQYNFLLQLKEKAREAFDKLQLKTKDYELQRHNRAEEKGKGR